MVNFFRLIYIKLILIMTIVWPVIDSRVNEKTTLSIIDDHNLTDTLTTSVSPVDLYTNNSSNRMRSKKSQDRTAITTNLPIISKNTVADHISSSTPLITKSPSAYDQVPCTCGIFLGSQLKSQNITNNSALIISELNRFYNCDKRGQMRCQTNCLEQIMQFLPKSDRIICASSSDDLLKEKAYLLIKNCDNYWINTKLTSGHEYCCKDGKPYKCTNK
ncbi:follicle cell protein 3C-1 [Glossina fuscipes]|uniref:Follicle cell protein 3C-1 n=1 Tax=Glossina fuscipes TaxID=7396 RepID=A0A9C5ZK22_9MUSC|nr:follicle cell protein 3C-1 [Glossina fuscipes]